MSTTPVRAAARERSIRTLAQGAGIDVAIAVAVALLAWLPDADVSSKEAWLIFLTAVAKSVLTALASYIMRLKLKPSEETAILPPEEAAYDLGNPGDAGA